METAKLENINKFSKLGLRRRPTYDEIVNLLDENKKIGMPLPNRDATFFRNSPEGSFFDGSNYLEELKDEQERLLLRQMNEMLLRKNARTEGRTFHTERFRTLPLQSPTIAPPNPMDVDAEGMPSRATSGYATPLSGRMTQGTQLHAEIAKRLNTISQRRQDTATNHAQGVARQTQQTLAEQLANVAPPRPITQYFPMDTDSESTTQQPKAKAQPRRNLFVDTPQSSNQAPVPVAMDTSSKPKRYVPETRVEPRGKVGRPRTFKPEPTATAHQIADKSGGENPEQERPQRRENRNKEKQRLRLEARIEKEKQNKDEEDGTDTKKEKEPKERKRSKVRHTIHKPVIASKVGIQNMYEEFNNAKNKNIITAEEFKEFNEIFKDFRKAKGAEKKQYTNQAKDLYKRKLYNKLKKKYDEES